MDVDAIEPGVDFVERIEAAIGSADALVVVIGRGWLTATDARGRRRLDDPEDFVRIEVGSALRRDTRVIPVLVGGATMPTQEELPGILAELARRNSLTVSDLDWRSGIGRLISTLDRVLGHDGRPAPPRPRPQAHESPDVLAAVLGLAGAALLVAGTGLRAGEFLHPDFGGGDAPNLGFFTSLAPMAVVVGAVGALLLSYTAGARGLGSGLLLGFALGGVAKYVGLLGMSAAVEVGEEARLVTGSVLALGGSALLAVAAVRRGFRRPGEAGEAATPASLPRGLVLLGAALVVGGTLIPFNGGGSAFPREQVLIDRAGHWEAFDPIATALLAVLAAVVLTAPRGRVLAAGALVALGLLSSLLWLRYVGVPILQSDAVASPRAGGFVGLAGGASILLAGLVARSRATSAAFAGHVPAGRAT
jgi:hypothetical protein